MFLLQEREKRRRRVLIEQMKAHEAQEVRKTNSTNVGNVRFSTISVPFFALESLVVAPSFSQRNSLAGMLGRFILF